MGLGLHGGGVGTVRFLASEGATVTVTDLRTPKELEPALRKLSRLKGITYVLGRHRVNDFKRHELIVKNPGVRHDSKYLAIAEQHSIPITTDIAIFLERSRARIIGVTGTRGKSTTVSLIAAFLKKRYRSVIVAGNIRTSILSVLPRVKPSSWVILELSSFQLADLQYEMAHSKSILSGKPDIAVITNLMRDHLNWHRSRNDYERAKANIFRYQTKDNDLFINPSDSRLRALVKNARSTVQRPTLQRALRPIVDQNLGRHYRASVGLAIGVARRLGVSTNSIERVLRRFRGLTGRQELVRTIQGVRFVNDTTATTPDATIAAVKHQTALLHHKKRLILIAGGADKKLDFREMARVIKAYVKTTILLPGSATPKILRLIHRKAELGSILLAPTMPHAVRAAWSSAVSGDIVLLSPGATSFGLFLNEFDRGTQFARIVQSLLTTPAKRSHPLPC